MPEVNVQLFKNFFLFLFLCLLCTHAYVHLRMRKHQMYYNCVNDVQIGMKPVCSNSGEIIIVYAEYNQVFEYQMQLF